MEYEWDQKKAVINQLKHGIAFERMRDFEWETATIFDDVRFAYGEKRQFAYGYIGSRLYTVTFTMRAAKIRIIGLRKSNARERKYHETKKKTGFH